MTDLETTISRLAHLAPLFPEPLRAPILGACYKHGADAGYLLRNAPRDAEPAAAWHSLVRYATRGARASIGTLLLMPPEQRVLYFAIDDAITPRRGIAIAALAGPWDRWHCDPMADAQLFIRGGEVFARPITGEEPQA